MKFQSRAIAALSPLTAGVLLATLIGLVLGGGAAVLEFSDPGPIVRYGLPIAKGLMNLSMAIAIGTAIFTAFAIAKENQAFRKLLNLVAASAAAWGITGAVHFLLSFVSVSGASFSFDEAFSNGLFVYATEIELGISLALNLLAAVFISTLAVRVPVEDV